MEKISIVIPCYNEEAGVPNLVAQLEPVRKKLGERFSLDLIFVDDGSRDRTVELIHDAYPDDSAIQIIRHANNAGLGAALRTGFAAAEGDVVVTIDSDCTYPPSEIPPLLEMLDSQTDIVTASPYHSKGRVVGVPGYRLFMSKSLSAVYRVILRSDLHTFTALFRAHRRDTIKQVHFQSNGFLATTEHLVRCMRAGFRVREYPTTLNVRRYGVSKIKLFDTILDHLKLLFRLLTTKSR